MNKNNIPWKIDVQSMNAGTKAQMMISIYWTDADED
jgi:hypothetical protein